jgi:FtsH-binding integral membrane protein
VSELRQFQVRAGIILAAALLALAGILIVLGHGSAVSGLLAGGLLGYANLTWMVSSATRLIGRAVEPRAVQLVAFVRFLMVACLLGVILIIGHVNPISAVAGYGLFPIAAAVSGWRSLGGAPA